MKNLMMKRVGRMLMVGVLGFGGVVGEVLGAGLPYVKSFSVYGAKGGGDFDKTRLLYSGLEQDRKNAAIFYGRASTYLNEGFSYSDPFRVALINEYDVFSTKDYPGAKVLKGFATTDGKLMFRNFDKGSRCVSGDWGVDRKNMSLYTLIPFAAESRTLAQLNNGLTRAYLSQGKYDEAIGCMRRGVALGMHVAQERGVLIEQLVGVSIIRLQMLRIEEMRGVEGSPNMYWSLRELSGRLPDVRRGAMYELDNGYTNLGLKQSEFTTMSLEAWYEVYDKYMDLHWSANNAKGTKESLVSRRMKNAAFITLQMSRAKRYLKGKGYSDERIGGLEPHQVWLSFQAELYDTYMSKLKGIVSLPTAAAVKMWGKVGQRIEFEMDRERSKGAFLFSSGVSVGTAIRVDFKFKRNLAAMINVEAIRGYAASHGGKLPESLDDLVDMPAAVDPATGGAFGYSVKGNVFVLTAEVVDDQERSKFRYEVTVK